MADRAALTGDAGAPPTAATRPASVAGEPPESGEVVVHVVGAVARPGVQHLPAGSRIEDAVDAAGGAKPDADLSRLNLAAVLDDGEQIYVVRVGEQPPAAVVGASPPVAGAAPGPPIDLNRASEAELDTLPGVGPATAAAIVATRQERGGFRSVDDLLDVRGIGEAKLAELRDRVKV
jgi:competence protein ComEA